MRSQQKKDYQRGISSVVAVLLAILITGAGEALIWYIVTSYPFWVEIARSPENEFVGLLTTLGLTVSTAVGIFLHIVWLGWLVGRLSADNEC